MQFHIERMACGGCVRTITDAVTRIDPAARVEADTVARTVTVGTSASQADVRKVLADAGYPATVN